MRDCLPPPPLLRRMMEAEQAPESVPDLYPDRWVELEGEAEAPPTEPAPPPSTITMPCPVSQPPSICPHCGQPARIVSSSVLTIRPEGT